MSIVQRILAPREQRGLTATEALRRLNVSTATRSGAVVTEQGAMQLMAVFTAVGILAGALASVPLKLYRRADDGTRKEARDHPLFKILHDQPNSEMTAVTFWETAMVHLSLWGNAYMEISRNFQGEVMGLWPLHPGRTRPVRTTSGQLAYETRIGKGEPNNRKDETVLLPARNVLHVMGLSVDGVRGLSVIGTVREGIGLGFAYEAFGSYFFGNNTVPGLMLTTDAPMKKEKVDELERRIREGHEGLTNSQRLMILTDGLKPDTVTMPLEDAQFLEQRKYTRSEIMGLFNIPPHMSNDTEKVSSWGTGIEQMSLGFVKVTMLKYFRRFEQSINMKLFGANAQSPLYPEFDPDGFLRGDFKTRMEGYAIGRQWGWISINDIKRRENEPTIGEAGDIYLVPSNMVPLDRLNDIVDKQTEPTPTPVVAPASKDAPDDRPARSFRLALTDVTERILRREQNDVSAGIRKLLKKGSVEDVPPWLEQFYAEHRSWAAKQATPVFAGIADAVGVRDGQKVHAVVAAYVERLCAESMDGLGRAIRGEDELDHVLAAVDRSASGIADREIDAAIIGLTGEGGEDVDYAKVQKMLDANGDALLEKMRGLIPQQQEPPTINATLVVPEGAITVNVPPQPAPIMPPIEVRFPKDAIAVNVQPAPSEQDIELERNAQGTIVGIKAKKKK